MNRELQNKLAAIGNKSPDDQMLELASMYKSGMAARSKAYSGGLIAIHNQLCEFTTAIQTAQEKLLIEHPELIMMAL